MSTIKTGQRVSLSIAPTDEFGNPTIVDGVPTWTVSDESLVSLEVQEGGLTAIVSSLGLVGEVTVEVFADADLSQGVRTLTSSELLVIVAGEAADLGVHVDPVLLNVAEAVALNISETAAEETAAEETAAEETAAEETAAEETAAEEPVVLYPNV